MIKNKARALAVAFAVAVSLWGLFYPASAQAASYELGMNFLWGKGDPAGLEDRFRRMKALGITQARTDWEWRAVEPKAGKYDWSAIDNMMKLAHKYGITIFPIVHYAPDWALPTTKKPDGVYQMAPRTDAFKAYGQFLAASIDRYGPRGKAPFAFTPITHWQVWNEPNIKEFWGPKPNAKNFVRMMRVVNDVVGSRRTQIKLVHAGISRADFNYLWELWELDANYGRLFDVMAVHPYFFNPRGGVRAVDDIDADDPQYAPLGVIGSASDPGYLAKVFNIQLFLTLKKSPKPIWITEIGFMAGDGNPYAIPEDEEAKLANQTLAFIDQKLTKTPFGQGARGDIAARVERVYWFALDDYGFPDDTGNFGLYRMDGSPRPLKDVIDKYTP